MNNINFKKYLTQKSFNMFVEAKDVVELRKEIVLTLEELALNRILKPIVFSEDHITNFSYAWNKFINQEISSKKDEAHLMYEIERFIEKVIIFNAKGYSKEERTEDLNIKEFNEFTKFLNVGDLHTYCTPEADCFNCGTPLSIIFKNWEPTFFEFKEILEKENYRKVVHEDSTANFLNKMDHFPAEQCFTEFIKIKDFEFKTGNLIITDWIRLEEFTKTVEPNSDIYHFKISNAKGRNDAFEHYFNQGFISMGTNSGLDMYSLKEEGLSNCLFFGKMNYDKTDNDELNKKDFKFEKTINRGLRATTIIEKETLIDIVYKTTNDLEQAKLLVNNYLKKNKLEIINKKITPGTYSVIFNLNSQDVSELLFPRNITEDFNPKVFLYPKELYPSFENKPKKRKI